MIPLQFERPDSKLNQNDYEPDRMFYSQDFTVSEMVFRSFRTLQNPQNVDRGLTKRVPATQNKHLCNTDATAAPVNSLTPSQEG
jgi:hypothetical protein